MDPGESPSQKSPGSRGFFDPALLLGGIPMFPGRLPTSRDQPSYLPPMPSAFSMFNQPIYPPRSPHSDFGGLGSLREGLTSPLGSPSALTHSPLSPTAGLHWPLTASVHLCNLATLGGAAWWRHARSMAGLNEYYSGTLGLQAPTFGSGGREREASPPGFDSLYRQSQAQKSLNGAFCSSLFQTAPPVLPGLSLSSPTKSSSSVASSSSSAAVTTATGTANVSTIVSTSSSSSNTTASRSKGQRGRPKGSSNRNSSGSIRIPSTGSLHDKPKDLTISPTALSIPQPPHLVSAPIFTHSSVITKATTTSSTSITSATASSQNDIAMSPSTKADQVKKSKKDSSSSDSSISGSDDDSDDLGSSSDSSSSNSDISSGSDNSDVINSESDSDDKEMQEILQTKKQLEEKQKHLLKQEQQLKMQQKESLERKLKDQQQVTDQHIREQEQRLKQEQLKMQLEQHIKQQQHQLKKKKVPTATLR